MAPRLRARIITIRSGRNGDRVGAGDGYGDSSEVVLGTYRVNKGVDRGRRGAVLGAILDAPVRPCVAAAEQERTQEVR